MTSGTDSTTLSRRAALAITPAALTCAVPAGASVIDPDHELLELGRQRAALVRDYAAADTELTERVQRFWADAPEQPDALRTLPDDTMAIGVRHYEGRFVGVEHLDTVRRHLGYNEGPFKTHYANVRWYHRCVEVVAALEAWEASVKAREDAFGVTEALQVTEDFETAIEAIEARIIPMRATTLPGLRLKAEIAKSHHTGGDHVSIGALIDDLTEDA